MKRLAFAAAVLLLAKATSAESPPTYTIPLDGHNFTLPIGFTIERVSNPALVERPIAIDFDERGRLYATEVDGAIEKPDIQAQKKAHRLMRLEDTDGDGRFDKSTVFADQLAFPEGVMWLKGSVYVGAPPQIWKLTDTNDDGVADERKIWFDGQTITGCANDLHGPYLGPDGWIYWNKGAFAKQTHTLANGKTFATRASHIFRARPDGTGIEPVMTGGMDNPVDTVFTPGGERIFSTTFFQRPAAGLRDGLIHAIYGGIYGKDQEAIYEPVHKWTSPELMPVLVHHGASAPCGLHRLESDQLGAEYKDNVFSCQFNLRKISRHVLKPSGSTYTTEDHDFLVSDNTDFHPTDVIEDADGSLLVVDTGGWYKLCCPSSQLVKAEVLGAIYRVRKDGAHKIKNSRGEGSSALTATAAVWAACRMENGSGLRSIRDALAHSDETVRQAAIHALSVHRDKEAVKPLIALLQSPSRHNRRAAAEALGRIGDAAAVRALLAALADAENDRALDHSLTYALIEIGETPKLRAAIQSDNPRVRRAALVALDQTGGQLDPHVIVAHLDHADKGLRDSARWIASRHAEWGEPLTAYLTQRLANSPSEAEQPQLVELLAKLAKSPAIEQLLTATVSAAQRPPVAARIALQAMAASGHKELPAIWSAAIVSLLDADSPVLPDALATLKAIPPAKPQAEQFTIALLALGDSKANAEQRLAALALVPGGVKSVSQEHLAVLLDALQRDQPATLRGVAADVVSKARLAAQQLAQLANRLPRCSPLELDRLVTAFAQSTDETAGLALIAALGGPELRSVLTVESVKQRLVKYGPTVQAEAQKLYAAIDAEHAGQSARMEELLKTLPGGDIRRGQAVFNSSRTSCRACHTIGYVGGKIGPDLTKIGQIRQPRDLVESIVFPSATFVRSYEPLLVRTADGEVLSGVVKQDLPHEITLTLAADKEVRIARADVEATLPGKVSIMPAGLDKQLSLQELADLVEFLRNCK
jgi:putative membrane-bound dehydrogenase-like protein